MRATYVPTVVGLCAVALVAACEGDRSAEPSAAAPAPAPAPAERPPAAVVDAAAVMEEPAEPKPDVDEPTVDLSELHYAQRARTGGHSHGDDEIPKEPSGELRFAEPDAVVPSWISDAGRRSAEMAHTISVTPEMPLVGLGPLYPSGLCTKPQPYVGTMTRTMSVSGIKLKSPASTFSSEASAVAFLKTVKARMPFYLPFRHADVRLGSGWIYASGSSHRGQDYSRSGVPDGEDSTFAVRASAAGVVTDVFWSDLSGNVVVIEHTAPGGQKYMTYYSHLRNGRDADRARALAIDCTSVTDDRCEPYKKFATSFSTHVSWGTNAHTIAVAVGDHVAVGQLLGQAGNTGYGGAGWGLEDDGSPTSSRGNVHLHAYFGVAHPTEAGTYIAVDPYGVYDTVDSKGCYDLLKDTAFDRLIAPFFPTFHGVPIEIVERYAGYYRQMGWSPRTLDVHRSGGGTRVSGAFAPGIPGPFVAVGYQSLETYQATFDTQLANGLVPRQTSVTYTPSGEPRFSGLFRPLEPGEVVERRSALDDAAWDDRWNARVVADEWRVDDYNGYVASGGQARRSALFTSHAGRPFVFYSRRTRAELEGLIASRRAEGYVPVKVNANEATNPPEYAAMLRKLPGCWRAHLDLSAASYQYYVSLRAAHGYRLEHVQAHGDPARYSAVFVKHVDDGATCGW